MHLISWLKKTPTNGHQRNIFPLPQHLFVNYSNDFICNLVIDACNQLNINIENSFEDNDNEDRCYYVFL